MIAGPASRRAAAFAVLGLLLVAVGIFATLHGVQRIPLETGIRVLLGPLLPDALQPDVPASYPAILLTLRLPRTLLAIIAGAGLALAGVAMQGITRNPLISPYTIGISPAASFGAKSFRSPWLRAWTLLCGFAAWKSLMAWSNPG